jgi:hypothetical protein
VRLAERMGLSRTSLTRIARGLIDAGLVTEGEIHNSGSRGRPTESLDLQPDAAQFLGLKLTGDSAYLVCTNLAATVIAEATAPLPSKDFDEVVEFLTRFIAEFVGGGLRPVALGVAVAGDVVSRGGIVLLQRSNFLGWHDVPLAARLFEATGLPVTIANDVQALAGAHHWFGGLQKHRSLIVYGLGARASVAASSSRTSSSPEPTAARAAWATSGSMASGAAARTGTSTACTAS